MIELVNLVQDKLQEFLGVFNDEGNSISEIAAPRKCLAWYRHFSMYDLDTIRRQVVFMCVRRSPSKYICWPLESMAHPIRAF